MIPFLEVSHLPSSSSFYSTITQPLGLRYISAGNSTGATAQPGSLPSPTLTYGFAASTPPTPVFELRQVKGPLKRSRVVLSASSPDAVGHFRALVQRSKDRDGSETVFGDQAFNSLGYPSDKVIETDLDGNVMEVVYVPPPGYPEGYTGSTIRKTQSNSGEVSRILSWNYDVVVSDPGSAVALAPLPTSSTSLAAHRRPGPFSNEDMAAPVVRRSITSTTTTLVEPMDSSLASPRQNSSGSMSTSTVVGTLLGVAAAGAAIGAGVAYGVMKNDRSRSTSEYDVPPPPFQRRSTFPERCSEYSAADKDYVYDTAERRGAPTLVSRHSYHSQAPLHDNDKASRLSLRSKPPSTARSQLLLTEAEHRSQASSRHSARTQDLEDMVAADYRSQASTSRQTGVSSRLNKYAPSLSRSNTLDVAGDGVAPSYVSARSHKTASTVRPAGPMRQHTEPVLSMVGSMRPASKAASGAPSGAGTGAGAAPSSRAGSRISARDLGAASHAGGGSSRVSARQMALPRSGVGSSHAAWDKDGDEVDSIAPSDSISCVGSRRSERLYQ